MVRVLIRSVSVVLLVDRTLMDRESSVVGFDWLLLVFEVDADEDGGCVA